MADSPPPDRNELLDAKAAARALGMSMRTFRRMKRRGELPDFDHHDGRPKWFRFRLDAWIDLGGLKFVRRVQKYAGRARPKAAKTEPEAETRPPAREKKGQ